MLFLDVPSAVLWLTRSIFRKWKVLRWYTYRASFVDIGSVVLELNFQMFSQQQTVILGCFWVTFWPELPKMFSILFENLNSDDMQDDASDMPMLLLKYWEMVQIGLQTDILAHLESFFVYAFLHPTSYTPRFFQVKDIIKVYISVVSFINIAYAVVELKSFKVFRINSATLFGFWGLMKPFWGF